MSELTVRFHRSIVQIVAFHFVDHLIFDKIGDIRYRLEFQRELLSHNVGGTAAKGKLMKLDFWR